MLKLCGALFVFGASAWMGLTLLHRLQRRVRVLQSLIYAFSQLRTEIAFLQSPLPQAAAQAAAQTGDAVFKGFASRLQAGDLPHAAMQAALLQTDCLTQSDFALLLRAAQPLGSSDVPAQTRHIEGVLTQLEAQLAQAQGGARTNGRLYMTAGVLGGMLLVILLI